MKRILIATPIKNGTDENYMEGLMDVMMRHHPDREFLLSVIGGPSVNFARNDQVEYAYNHNCDEILFVDDDMKWNMQFVDRICSHDVDIVGGIYSKRKPGPPFWLVCMEDQARPREDGLCAAKRIATGFLRVKVAVFRKLFEEMPDRHFTYDGDLRCEYFPMGVIGTGTAEARLEEVRELLRSGETDIAKITAAAFDRRPPGIMHGEDYYFCNLARKHGFTVWADTQCVIRHLGLYPYPEQKYIEEHTIEQGAT